MMGLHQNYAVSWLPERVEDCSIEHDFEGMLSSLPTDVVPGRGLRPFWNFTDPAPNDHQTHAINRNHSVVLPDIENDPTVLLPNICGERAFRYPQVDEYELLNPKVERGEVMPMPNRSPARSTLPTDLTLSNGEDAERWAAINVSEKELYFYNKEEYDKTPDCFEIRPYSSFPARDSTGLVPTSNSALRPDSIPSREEQLAREQLVREEQFGALFGDGNDIDDEYLFDETDFEEEIVPTTICVDRPCSQVSPLRPIEDDLRSKYREDAYSIEPSYSREPTILEGDVRTDNPPESGSRSSAGVLDIPATSGSPGQPISSYRPQEVNHVIEDMPEDTAEAFKELFRLVGDPSADTLLPVEDSDVGSKQVSSDLGLFNSEGIRARGVQHRDSKLSLISAFGQSEECFDSLYRVPFTTSSDERPEVDDKRLASTIADQVVVSSAQRTPVIIQSPSLANEVSSFNVAQGPFSRQAVDPKVSRASCDIVLYDPKPEPNDISREKSSGFEVKVNEEERRHLPGSDVVSVKPVDEYALVTSFSKKRKLIRTALDSFEHVRQHIVKNPTYGLNPTESGSGKRLRADLKAGALMRKKGYWLHEVDRPIGHVEGVKVGDRFRYRMEMALIGLHRAVQAGIAVVPQSYSPYGVPVASSVVLGVGDPYQDDYDMGDKVVYSGQGGLCGKTKEARDQELKRGNLALSNSFDLNLPVRLIRGHRDPQNGPTAVIYSYDGLYMITKMNYVTGVNGKKVYMFNLDRLEGQDPILNTWPTPVSSKDPASLQLDNAICWTPQTDAMLISPRSTQPTKHEC